MAAFLPQLVLAVRRLITEIVPDQETSVRRGQPRETYEGREMTA